MTVQDPVTGNDLSGITITDNDTATSIPAACGGTLFAGVPTPGNFDIGGAGSNGIDCVTAERISYDDVLATIIPAPSGTLILTRANLYYLDLMAGPAGTQWQTADPLRGARVGLASGAPMAKNGFGQVYPLGAGSSFYRQLNLVTDPRQEMRTIFFASANTDTSIASYLRYTDANNNIRLEYLPLTQTWNLVERVGGVDNVLSTVIFDLTGPGNVNMAIQAIGTQLTTSGNPIALPGEPWTTAVVAPGPTAYLVIAAAAGITGFGPVRATHI